MSKSCSQMTIQSGTVASSSRTIGPITVGTRSLGQHLHPFIQCFAVERMLLGLKLFSSGIRTPRRSRNERRRPSRYFLAAHLRIDPRAENVLHKPVGGTTPIQKQIGVEQRQLLRNLHGRLQRAVGEFCRLPRLIELAQRLGEEILRFLEFLRELLYLRKVKEIPILLLLHDLHQPESGQLDIQVIGLVARLEPRGFKDVGPRRTGIPEERDAAGMVVAAIENQKPLAKRNVAGNRHALRADGGSCYRLEGQNPVAFAKDLKLQCHMRLAESDVITPAFSMWNPS